MPEAPELGNVAASDFRASPAADKVGGGGEMPWRIYALVLDSPRGPPGIYSLAHPPLPYLQH